MESDSDEQGFKPSKVPAFAVYKNLIPGVRSFEDTSVRSRKKKNRKRKSKGNADHVKQESVPASSSPKKKNVIKREEQEPDPPSIEASKPKQKNKKRKLSESLMTSEDHTNNTSSPTASTPGLNDLNKKKKKKKKRLELAEPSRNTFEAPQKNPVEPKQKKPVVVVESDDENEEEVPVPAPQIMNGLKPKKKKQANAQHSASAAPPAVPTRTSRRLASIESLFDSAPIHDSALHGKDVFEWLIHPMTTETFFAEHWEKKPLHLKRTEKHDLFKWLMTSSTLDDVLRKNNIKFGKNIDITSYIDGERQTHNPADGTRALPAVVWDYFSNGNSVRFLNPQTYIKPIWRMNAALQEYLGTFVGCNAYLTPPDSQGFAPHFDDIEAFILQIEGYKNWKLYKPRQKNEQLPRFSSKNFNEEKDKLGAPILDVTLGPGDFLYFPRGIIHQANCTDEHSLHLTISAYQTNTYGDLISAYLPMALEEAMASTLELRRGLPLDYLSYMGIVHQDRTEEHILEQREAFQTKVKKLAAGILTKSCDLAVDQLGKKLVWDSLPPFLSSKEKRRTVFADGEFIHEGTVLNRVEMGPEVEVKLVRRHACRLVLEEGNLRLYFNAQNSLEYHGEEPAYLELPDNAGPAVEFLFTSYPEFVAVEKIPGQDQDLKIQVCADLWEKGIIMTKNSLAMYAFDGEDCLESDEEMEEPADSESSEEVSAEEEENDEDREFIDDEDEENDNDMSNFIDDDEDDRDDEEEGTDNDMSPHLVIDEDDDSGDDDDDDEPPILVKRKQVFNSNAKKFIM